MPVFVGSLWRSSCIWLVTDGILERCIPRTWFFTYLCHILQIPWLVMYLIIPFCLSLFLAANRFEGLYLLSCLNPRNARWIFTITTTTTASSSNSTSAARILQIRGSCEKLHFTDFCVQVHLYLTCKRNGLKNILLSLFTKWKTAFIPILSRRIDPVHYQPVTACLHFSPEETKDTKELQLWIFRMSCEVLYTNRNLALKHHVREKGRRWAGRVRQP
jgi:hypothetical protein